MALCRVSRLTARVCSQVSSRFLMMSSGNRGSSMTITTNIAPSWGVMHGGRQRPLITSSVARFSTYYDRDEDDDAMEPNFRKRDRGFGGPNRYNDGGRGYGGGGYGDYNRQGGGGSFGQRNQNFRGPRNNSYSDVGEPMRPIDWSKEELTPFEKNFYNESEVTKNRPEAEIQQFWNDHDIKIAANDGNGRPNPTLTFEEIDFPDYIAEQVRSRDFDKPTPIQAQSFPIAMSGRNLVSIAQTGSGKTLGYMLPAIMQINSQNSQGYNPRHGPKVLIVAPTRELAQQIRDVASEFGSSSNIRNACLFGGAGKPMQERDVRRGPEIVIATPGRLIDFLQMGTLSLRQVTYCVLDEADRMLDMGFEPQIRKILSQVRPDRQMLMWSATWPREVQQIAREFIQNYVQVNVGSENLSANHDITQHVEVVDDYEKDNKLMELLEQIKSESGDTKILIFSSTKRGCERVSQLLNRKRIDSVVMHGDKTQQQREIALYQFRNDRVNILVATDVAARGLDVDGIGAVINYDYPQRTEDYVHRIGRTGRKGLKGVSYTFFTETDKPHVEDLIEVLKEANQEVNPELLNFVRPSRGGGGSRSPNTRYGGYNNRQFGNKGRFY